MKQTAVEWLVQELNLYAYLSQINHAKDLEKQQIIDALHHFGIEGAEQYYNQTFKKK
jgi:hypothetical protein